LTNGEKFSPSVKIQKEIICINGKNGLLFKALKKKRDNEFSVRVNKFACLLK
jgi:hypothetical protein